MDTRAFVGWALISGHEPDDEHHGAPEPDCTCDERDEAESGSPGRGSADFKGPGNHERDSKGERDERPAFVPAGPVASLTGIPHH